jgi:hypothetical protein
MIKVEHDTPIWGAIHKLATAGEQAGFSVEQMIALLNSGITVETLLNLIDIGLAAAKASSTTICTALLPLGDVDFFRFWGTPASRRGRGSIGAIASGC